jgi:hypothetical protein
MSNSPAGFDPFWMFRLPLSGDVNQRITAPWFSPSLTVNYAGDAANKALDRLKRDDPDDYAELLRDRQQDGHG